MGADGYVPRWLKCCKDEPEGSKESRISVLTSTSNHPPTHSTPFDRTTRISNHHVPPSPGLYVLIDPARMSECVREINTDFYVISASFYVSLRHSYVTFTSLPLAWLSL
jgi:hypothetical protein